MGDQANIGIVTGGARGIGFAIARNLARTGVKVAIADLDESSARKAVAELPGSGHLALRMDVADEGSVEAGFDAIEKQMGAVRILVANAGILLQGDQGRRLQLWELDLDHWERTFATNTRGTFLCCRGLLRRRRSQPVSDGRIVTLSSVAAQLGGYRTSAAYIASKSAVIGLTKAVAREGATMGITANVVAPGLIDAPMLHQTMKTDASTPDVRGLVPLQRLGTTEDVANAVAYLVSPEAGYVTGSVIDVNGGYRMQ